MGEETVLNITILECDGKEIKGLKWFLLLPFRGH